MYMLTLGTSPVSECIETEMVEVAPLATQGTSAFKQIIIYCSFAINLFHHVRFLARFV